MAGRVPATLMVDRSPRLRSTVGMKKISVSASPQDYLQGQIDRIRYEADGHVELMERYHGGSPSYQMGWDGADQHPRVLDPHFAS